MITCPDEYVQSGFGKLLNGGDVSNITEKYKQMCLDAVSMFKSAKQYLSTAPNLPKGSIAKLTSGMEVRAVMFIFSKKSRTRKTFASLGETQQALLADLYKTFLRAA
eukprot:846522-Pyramimonas_sp.AAC.1